MNVDELLAEYLNEKIEVAQELDESFADLWGHIKDLVLAGGKRSRPKLVIDTYTAHGGRDTSKAMNIAAAWEMIHVSLLIHDDIMDGDIERRGRPTIEAIYQDRNVAILAGDLCLSAAGELVLNSRLTLKLKATITSLLHTAYQETIAGQLLDIDAKKHDPLKVAEYKTSKYSFVGPMLSGALVAGANKHDLHLLRQNGINQGIAFQLQNDLDDIEQDLAAGRHTIATWLLEEQGS